MSRELGFGTGDLVRLVPMAYRAFKGIRLGLIMAEAQDVFFDYIVFVFDDGLVAVYMHNEELDLVSRC